MALSKESVEKLTYLITFGLDIDAKKCRTADSMKHIVEVGYAICYPLYPDLGKNNAIRIIPVPGTMVEVAPKSDEDFFV